MALGVILIPNKDTKIHNIQMRKELKTHLRFSMTDALPIMQSSHFSPKNEACIQKIAGYIYFAGVFCSSLVTRITLCSFGYHRKGKQGLILAHSHVNPLFYCCILLSEVPNLYKVPRSREPSELPKLLVQCSGEVIEMHYHKIAFVAICTRQANFWGLYYQTIMGHQMFLPETHYFFLP